MQLQAFIHKTVYIYHCHTEHKENVNSLYQVFGYTGDHCLHHHLIVHKNKLFILLGVVSSTGRSSLAASLKCSKTSQAFCWVSTPFAEHAVITVFLSSSTVIILCVANSAWPMLPPTTYQQSHSITNSDSANCLSPKHITNMGCNHLPFITTFSSVTCCRIISPPKSTA